MNFLFLVRLVVAIIYWIKITINSDKNNIINNFTKIFKFSDSKCAILYTFSLFRAKFRSFERRKKNIVSWEGCFGLFTFWFIVIMLKKL